MANSEKVTDLREAAREFFGCDPGKYGHSRECNAMKGDEWTGPEPDPGCKDLTALLERVARERDERAAKIAEERARKMNVLGSDAKCVKTLTHAEIQAERVWEAMEIAATIRAAAREE